QHPELMGEYGVHLAFKALKGEPIDSFVRTPIDLITYDSFNKIIGISISDIKNPFFASLVQGAKDTALLFGSELKILNANNDDSQQLTDIMNLLKEKLNGVIINPTNSEIMGPAIELANQKNVPVITVDRKVNGGHIATHIASDNIEGGKMAAQAIAKSLHNKGTVIEIEGIPGTSAAHERGKGFNDMLSQFADIKIIARETANFDRKDAEKVMLRILKKGIMVDAVFAHNDTMILGVLDALKQMNKPLPVLVGFDAIDEAVVKVKQGELTATIAQKPYKMGQLAVQNSVNLFRNETISPVIPVELNLIQK
ncbi:MAG: substrate-binding domain-containing protein, partial [Desulfobacterales bacterium]|nr:substrate-binding domain-containing protein [Desulfobacterales bacterium]